jgi:hypothetical protein
MEKIMAASSSVNSLVCGFSALGSASSDGSEGASSSEKRGSGEAANKELSFYEKVEKVFKEVKSLEIKTHQDILCCTELYNSSSEEFDHNLRKYGEAYLQFCDQSIELTKARGIATSLARRMQIDDPFAINSSIALMFKVGGCGELSHLYALRARVAKLFAKVMILTQDVDPHQIKDHHALVLVSAEEISDHAIFLSSKKMRGNFLRTVKLLKGVVVVDPYLSKIIRCEDIDQDVDFLRKLHAMDVSKIKGLVVKDRSTKTSISLQTRLMEACRAADPKDFQLHLSFFPLLKHHRVERAVAALEASFVETKDLWKKSRSLDVVFIEGSEEMISSLALHLGSLNAPIQHGRVKDKDTYLLKILFQDYNELQKFLLAISEKR